MLLDLEEELRSGLKLLYSKVLAVVLAVLFLLGSSMRCGSTADRKDRPLSARDVEQQCEDDREVLFTRYLFPFEIVSVLLVAAIVGAVGPEQEEKIRSGAMTLPGVPPVFYLILSAILFTIGVIGALTRRNAIIVFICIEMMLNAVNLTLITFSRFLQSIDGVIFAFFVMAVAAAEAAVGWPSS